MNPVIRVEHFAKSFGKQAAATDVSFTVNQGDIYGFLGRNGAGKSTTIRAMLSLITPDGGTIELFGKSLNGNRKSILTRVGSIVEKPDFYKYLSARKNLELLGRISGKSIGKNKIMEMLEFTGLKGRENDKVGGYSHGMRQRLGIAQALLHNPELIVLDEPTTGLDPQGIIDIRNLILQLRNDFNKTIILSSHLLSEVELICNRMVIIDKGKTLIEGDVQGLLHSDEHLVSFSFANAKMVSSSLQLAFPDLEIQQIEDHRISILISESQIPMINAWLVGQNIPVMGIESRRKLEDYFLNLLQS